MSRTYLPAKTIVQVYTRYHAGQSIKKISTDFKMSAVKVKNTLDTVDKYLTRSHDVRKKFANYVAAVAIINDNARFDNPPSSQPTASKQPLVPSAENQPAKVESPESTPADPFARLEIAETSFKQALTDFITDMVNLKVEAVNRDNQELRKANQDLQDQITHLTEDMSKLEEIKEQAKNHNWVSNLRKVLHS